MGRLLLLPHILLPFVTAVTAGSICADFAVALGTQGRVIPSTTCSPGNCPLGSLGVSLSPASLVD